MPQDWVSLVLDPLLEQFGQEVTYLSPDEQISLPAEGAPPLVGLLLVNGVPLGPDAEDTGGIAQGRTGVRLRQADFPDDAQPVQGGFLVLGEDRWLVTDVLADRNGWFDLPLARAPE